MPTFRSQCRKIKGFGPNTPLSPLSRRHVGLWRYELGNVLWKKVKFEGGNAEEMRMHLMGGTRLLVESVEGPPLDASCSGVMSSRARP